MLNSRQVDAQHDAQVRLKYVVFHRIGFGGRRRNAYLVRFASFALCRSGRGVAAEEAAKELLRFVLVESEIRVSVVLLPEAATERSRKAATVI